MPHPAERKNSTTAKKRVIDKYLEADKESHPFRLWAPLKKLTEAIRTLLTTKNFVRIITEMDINQYVMLQYYIYCDKDVWACGDALVFNSNPDKKIMSKMMCTKLKKSCIGYDEYNDKHFITICPKCKCVVSMIKDTHFKCPHCNFRLHLNNVNRMPFAKLTCSICPAHTGWDEAQKIKDVIRSKLVYSSRVKDELANKELDTLFRELEGSKGE